MSEICWKFFYRNSLLKVKSTLGYLTDELNSTKIWLDYKSRARLIMWRHQIVLKVQMCINEIQFLTPVIWILFLCLCFLWWIIIVSVHDPRDIQLTVTYWTGWIWGFKNHSDWLIRDTINLWGQKFIWEALL